MIQGLKTNPKDQDSHVLFFDVEALIGKRFQQIFFNNIFNFSSAIIK